MLFLAVFAGFLAENQREHFIEHKREKVLMKSMIKDLQTDTATFIRTYNGISSMITQIDSLIPLLSANDIEKNARQIYQHDIWNNLYYKIIYTDRTIQQLKNSGNFRLIRKAVVSDAIIEYDSWVRNYVIQMQDDYVWVHAGRLEDARSPIFKSEVFRNWLKGGYQSHIIDLPTPPYFLSTERSRLDRYINQLGSYAVANEWFLINLKIAIDQGKKLDSLIRAEYHLE
jgi:hypothetical protein